MLSGGGFGCKSKPDYLAEAALISKAIGGASVKVVWTREHDIHDDFYQLSALKGARRLGKIVAWRRNSGAPTTLRRHAGLDIEIHRLIVGFTWDTTQFGQCPVNAHRHSLESFAY